MSDRMDDLLTRHFARDEADEAAAARVLAKLRGPLPRQKLAWRRWPGVLLDWQFAPAWPRMAALATCAVLGFLVGTASIDRLNGLSAGSGGDFAAAVFEPEALTGSQP